MTTQLDYVIEENFLEELPASPNKKESEEIDVEMEEEEGEVESEKSPLDDEESK